MQSPASILPGTLDMLILKAVSLGPQHGATASCCALSRSPAATC